MLAATEVIQLLTALRIVAQVVVMDIAIIPVTDLTKIAVAAQWIAAHADQLVVTIIAILVAVKTVVLAQPIAAHAGQAVVTVCVNQEKITGTAHQIVVIVDIAAMEHAVVVKIAATAAVIAADVLQANIAVTEAAIMAKHAMTLTQL
jgi:hypothetical protein